MRRNRGRFQGNEERAMLRYKFPVLTPASRTIIRKCTVKGRPGRSRSPATSRLCPSTDGGSKGPLISLCPQPTQPPQPCWAPLLPPLLDALSACHALFWPCSFPLCSSGFPGVRGACVACPRPGQSCWQSRQGPRQILGIPALSAAHTACPA